MPEISLPTKTVQDIIKQTTDQILAAVNAKNTSKILRKRVFISNGIFNVPSGVTEVLITGGGAGGGGVSIPNASTRLPGSDGGNTTFGTLLTINGGKGATFYDSMGTPGASGGPGGESGHWGGSTEVGGGHGGDSGFFFGGRDAEAPIALANRSPVYCGGGAGYTTVARHSAGGGGGAFVYQLPVAVTPLTAIQVTLGVGGVGGNTLAGKGGNGWLAVEWWE